MTRSKLRRIIFANTHFKLSVREKCASAADAYLSGVARAFKLTPLANIYRLKNFCSLLGKPRSNLRRKIFANTYFEFSVRGKYSSAADTCLSGVARASKLTPLANIHGLTEFITASWA